MSCRGVPGPYEVTEIVEAPGGQIGAVRLRNTETGETREEQVGGIFVTIGHVPRSELLEGVVDLDSAGYVLTSEGSTATSRPGIFAAGDLADSVYRQAITAAGSGCQAALDAERHLRDLAASPQPAGRAAG